MQVEASRRFRNEGTWKKYSDTGRPDEFHKQFEKAAEKVRAELGRRYPNYIDGRERFSREGEFPDLCPFDTRIVVGYFQKGTRKDTSEAIAAARNASDGWMNTDYVKRTAIFRRVADLMAERKFELAAFMSFENGKNRFEAMADVDEAIDLVRYYCQELEANNGFTREMGTFFPGERAKSVLRPYGVWGVISPFNFPLAIAVGMSSGAMIAGNCAVFKPASDTPLMGLKFYELTVEAGLPKGVLNYVTGSGNTVGRELVENPGVDGIVFTGSKEVGAASYAKFVERSPRPFIAEMGGKNPVTVTARSDLEKAAEGVLKAAFGYSGQKCSACSRVYVDRKVKGEFMEKLLEKVKKVKVGNPLEADTFTGPLINEKALKNYEKYVAEAKRDGRIVFGGKVLSEGEMSVGLYAQPTIVDGLKKDHNLFKSELFVPIVCVAEVESLDEAIMLSNDVEYGLTAGIFSEDKQEVEAFFKKMQAGVLYANRHYGATTGATAAVQSFVGWKNSGSSGRGAGGPYYVQQFLREQSQTYYS